MIGRGVAFFGAINFIITLFRVVGDTGCGDAAGCSSLPLYRWCRRRSVSLSMTRIRRSCETSWNMVLVEVDSPLFRDIVAVDLDETLMVMCRWMSWGLEYRTMYRPWAIRYVQRERERVCVCAMGTNCRGTLRWDTFYFLIWLKITRYRGWMDRSSVQREQVGLNAYNLTKVCRD